MGNTHGTAINKVKVITYCPARFLSPLAGIKNPLFFMGTRGFELNFQTSKKDHK